MRRVLNLPLLQQNLELPFTSPEKRPSFLARFARILARRPRPGNHAGAPETGQGYSEFTARRYQSRLR